VVGNFFNKFKDRFKKKDDSQDSSLEESSLEDSAVSEESSLTEERRDSPSETDVDRSLAEDEGTHSHTSWFGRLKNNLTTKFNTASWHFSRRNEDVSQRFRLPSTQGLRFEELGILFFSPKNRPLIHRIFLISLAITVPYTAGKMLALFLHPTSETKVSKERPPPFEMEENQNFKEKTDRVRLVNLFNATSNEPGVSAKKGPFICEKSDKKTSLPIKLVNTIVLQDSIKSIAAVQVRGGAEALTLREGDTVERVAQISKIEQLRILLKNSESGECEYAENEDKVRDRMNNKRFNILNPTAGKKLMAANLNEGIRNVGNHFFIKKALREEAVKDMNNILTQARALQIRNPDGTFSFKMTEIIPGSIYSKLSISDGDVISAINGKKIENINELMNMFGRMKDINNMSLTLTREGQEQTLEYDFE